MIVEWAPRRAALRAASRAVFPPPIIATRCEGTEELIAENGLVIENATAEEIAKAIKILIDDRQLRNQMSTSARQRAQQFTWGRIAEKYLKIYERVK